MWVICLLSGWMHCLSAAPLENNPWYIYFYREKSFSDCRLDFNLDVSLLLLIFPQLKTQPSQPHSNSWSLISPRAQFLFHHRLWFSHYSTLLHLHPTGKWPDPHPLTATTTHRHTPRMSEKASEIFSVCMKKTTHWPCVVRNQGVMCFCAYVCVWVYDRL